MKMPARLFRYLFLALGVVLFGFIVASTDIGAALDLIFRMEWGLAVVTAAYLLILLGDSLSWHILLHRLPFTGGWFLKLWWIRMVGEAFNYVIPAGGMGGEPVKAVMLKRRSDMDYQEVTASLVAAKTTNVISLVFFLMAGFLLMQGEARVSDEYRLAAGIGLGCLAAGITGFFLVQRYGVSSTLAEKLLGGRAAGRVARAIEVIREQEGRLKSQYAERKGRFGIALLVASAVWALSVIEIYLALRFLGHPVSWTEAWIIEAGAQLVKAGTFFIPASLGAMDGAFVLLCGIFTGAPAVGIAAALVRRFRELVWTALGIGLGFLGRGEGENLRDAG